MAGWGSDLTILYSEDSQQWQRYLIHILKKDWWPKILQIQDQKLQELSLPPSASVLQHIASSKAALVILTPEFLKFTQCHPVEMQKLCRALKPSRTLAVLCGLLPFELSAFDVSCLPGYHSWKRLIVPEGDVGFLVLVIRATVEMIERSLAPKSQFKLWPDIVTQDSRKILVMLKNQVEEEQLVEVLIDGDGVRSIPVKRKNSYTLQLVIPEDMIRTSKTIRILVRCDGHPLGIRLLQCRSRMSQLYHLLSEVDCPHRLLGFVLGANTPREIDCHLSKIFQNNPKALPASGFSLLDGITFGLLHSREEHLPTLLHFSASYGFEQLTLQLLECPGAAAACLLPNCSGLTPSGLASTSGHHRIYGLLQDFQEQIDKEKKLRGVQSGASCSSTVYDNLKPHEKLILDLDHHQEFSQALNTLVLEKKKFLSDKIKGKKMGKDEKEEDRSESLYPSQKGEKGHVEAAGSNTHEGDGLQIKDVCPETQTKGSGPLVWLKRICSRIVNKNYRQFQVTRSYFRPATHQESYPRMNTLDNRSASGLSISDNISGDNQQSISPRYCDLKVLQKEESFRQRKLSRNPRSEPVPVPPSGPAWTLAVSSSLNKSSVISLGDHRLIEGEANDSDSFNYVEPDMPIPPASGEEV